MPKRTLKELIEHAARASIKPRSVGYRRGGAWSVRLTERDEPEASGDAVKIAELRNTVGTLKDKIFARLNVGPTDAERAACFAKLIGVPESLAAELLAAPDIEEALRGFVETTAAILTLAQQQREKVRLEALVGTAMVDAALLETEIAKDDGRRVRWAPQLGRHVVTDADGKRCDEGQPVDHVGIRAGSEDYLGA